MEVRFESDPPQPCTPAGLLTFHVWDVAHPSSQPRVGKKKILNCTGHHFNKSVHLLVAARCPLNPQKKSIEVTAKKKNLHCCCLQRQFYQNWATFFILQEEQRAAPGFCWHTTLFLLNTGALTVARLRPVDPGLHQ